MKLKALLLICLYLLMQNTFAEDAEPPNIGIFSLPSSQQPGPFYSFGQNIIDKNQVQMFIEPNFLKAKSQEFFNVTPSLIYGLTDSASIYITVPYAVNYTSETQFELGRFFHKRKLREVSTEKIERSSGIGDSGVQFEYAFYQSSDLIKTKQATVVSGVTLPSGSASKSPATGDGSVGYFLGGTYNQSYTEWLWFTSPGVSINAAHHNVQLGTEYLYQLGMGRNIHSVTNQYSFLALVELDGIYAAKNNISHRLDRNSGGNVIFITPSLWFSTPKLIIQLGISLPISQHLNGRQDSNDYFIAGNLGWTFN